MSNDKPPLVVHQPIPRRPFVKPAKSPVHEEDGRDRASGEDKLQQVGQQRSAQYDRSQVLAPGDIAIARHARDSCPVNGTNPNITSPLTPSASSVFLHNMTSSTLFGIFGSTAGSTPFEKSTPARSLFSGDNDNGNDNEDDDGIEDGEENSHNGVTDADVAAIRQASMDLAMLQRQGKRAERRRSSKGGYLRPQSQPQPQVSRARICMSVLGRAALLFALGTGYGLLVSRLRHETQATFDQEAAPAAAAAAAALRGTAYDATSDWRYLTSWGVSGVVLGMLLPWFDGLWDRTLGTGDRHVRDKGHTTSETDWALVVRGIGAFAGVAFAMRKLQWASTMQASLTLALANPFLWYLLDRSRSGLLLAAAVGLIGSAVLTALDLDLMPNPGSRCEIPYAVPNGGSGRYLPSFNGSSALPSAGRAESSSGAAAMSSSSSSSSSAAAAEAAAAAAAAAAAETAGGLVSLATVEMAIWMVSVLFCSCVCFGNIGRRLALRPAAAATSAAVGAARF